MRILALDLGTQCGWALKDGNRKAKFGTLDLSKDHHFDGCGMQYIKFKKWLAEQLPLNLILFEKVMAHDARAVHAQHKYGGLLAIVQTFADENNIPYCGEGVGTIKKFWLGTAARSKSGKEFMIKEARNRKFNVKDDNQADALALLHLGVELYELYL